MTGDPFLAHELAHAGDAGSARAVPAGGETAGRRRGVVATVVNAARSLWGGLRGARTGSEEDAAASMPVLTLLSCDKTCPEPKSPPKLTKTTSSGPLPDDRCGNFAWGVKWRLDNPTAKGGFVVQRVEANFDDIKDCDNNKVDVKALTGGVIDPAAWPFSEAWEINRCSQATGDTTDDSFSMCLWSSPPLVRCGHDSQVKTKGSIKIKGTAEFFDGLKLPSSFVATGKPPAGKLPVSRTSTALAGGTGSLDHSITATWNCCEGKDPFTHVAKT